MGSDQTPIPENLKRAMAERQIGSEALARKIDVSLGAVTSWRTGKRTPNWSMLERIGAELGKEPQYFYEPTVERKAA